MWTLAEWWVSLSVDMVAMRMCLTGVQPQGCNGPESSCRLWNPRSHLSSEPMLPQAAPSQGASSRDTAARLFPGDLRLCQWAALAGGLLDGLVVLAQWGGPGCCQRPLLPLSSGPALHHSVMVPPALPGFSHLYRCFPYKILACFIPSWHLLPPGLTSGLAFRAGVSKPSEETSMGNLKSLKIWTQ